MKLCHSWWQLSWWFLWRGCACVYVCGGQFGFMHEGFCWFWLVLGPLRASVRAWHSHRKEGSRRAKSCWGRDLAGGLVEKQGFRVRARGVRGGGCKNKIPPHPPPRLPGTQAPLATSAKALPWLLATVPWGQEGLCPVPPHRRSVPSALTMMADSL